MKDYELQNNEEKHQYEFHINDYTPRIEYILVKNEIYLTHTEVPAGLEGKGIGSRLILAVLKDIESKNLKLIPLCPFVAVYLKRHPEWKRILKPNINI